MAEPGAVRSLADHLSLRERIVARLRQAIITGELAQKSRLIEPELARQLNVSRTPLREAIRQLEAEGFVTTVPRFGSFVSEITPQDVKDLYAIRTVIEGLAARQAAENRESAKREVLEKILADLAGRTMDYRQYHEISGRFHDVIVGLSGNRRLQGIYQGLAQHVSRPAPVAPGLDDAAGSVLEVSRTLPEQREFPVGVGGRVAVGTRRIHVLPTPISSFTAVAQDERQAQALRASPIVAALAEQVDIPKKTSAAYLEALASLAHKEAQNGFTIPGVGKLVVRSYKARKGRKPQTGEEIRIPARKRLKFVIAKAAKDAALGGK